MPELRMASLLPLHGSRLGLSDLMPLYGKTAAVPCCVGPWSTQALRASRAGSLPCCAPQLAMMPLLNAQVCEELPLSPLHGPSLHLLIQCAGPCPAKAAHQQAPSTPWALGGDGAVWGGSTSAEELISLLKRSAAFSKVGHRGHGEQGTDSFQESNATPSWVSWPGMMGERGCRCSCAAGKASPR